MDWYPGDEYVDWFGVSFFTVQQRGKVHEFAQLGREHAKPFMIAEATPMGMYTLRGKLDWFRHFFDLIEKENAQVVSYINTDWDHVPMFAEGRWGDSRVQKFPEIQKFWMEKIAEFYPKTAPHEDSSF